MADVFQVGDRVRCLDDYCGDPVLVKGQEYTVAGLDSLNGQQTIVLDTPLLPNTWYAKRFEKA